MPEEAQEIKKLWNINFVIILILGFFTGTATQMVNPLISQYAVSLGASLTLAGTIVGIMSGISMVLRPVSGAACDLLNRKHVMIFSGLVTAISYAGYLLFNNIPAIIICRILQGLSFSFVGVARTAYATEYMPKDRMGEGISITTFGLVLSQAIGPNVGIWVSDNWGYRACFLVALLLSLTGSILLIIQPYKNKRDAIAVSRIKLNNLVAVDVIPYALFTGVIYINFQLGNSFVVLVGEERGIANVGFYFTTFSACTLIIRLLSGRVLDKLGLSVILFPAFLFASVSMVMIGSAYGIVFLVLAAVTKAFSQAAIPNIHGACIKSLGKERAGVVGATLLMGQDLLGFLSPPVAGFLAMNFGYGNMFHSFALFIILAVPGYMLLLKKEKKHPDRQY